MCTATNSHFHWAFNFLKVINIAGQGLDLKFSWTAIMSLSFWPILTSRRIFHNNCGTLMKHQILSCKQILFSILMSGSCHLDRALNVEISVACQIFVIVIFFNCSQILHLGYIQHIAYITSKKLISSDLYYFQICFSCQLKKQNKHLTFDALAKWHEPDINFYFISI